MVIIRNKPAFGFKKDGWHRGSVSRVLQNCRFHLVCRGTPVGICTGYQADAPGCIPTILSNKHVLQHPLHSATLIMTDFRGFFWRKAYFRCIYSRNAATLYVTAG